MITDEEILDYFIDKNRNAIISARINKNNIAKNVPYYKEYLENRFTDFNGNMCEVLYRIKNNIITVPCCKKCGKRLKYHGFKENSYGTWCSNACQLSDNDFITERESKYTVDDKEKRLAKMKKTKLEKYGSENFNNHDKFVKTCIEKYGSATPLTGKKRKEWEKTLLETTGKKAVVNPKKTKETKLLKYGDEKFSNREKAKKTMIERYGAKTTFESTVLRERVSETLFKKYGDRNFKNNEKAKATMFERYGVYNPFQLKEVRDKIVYEKIIETKRKNNTFNTSKIENSLFEFLKETYPNYTIIRNYEDERYKNKETGNKYRCDFYIKDLDLFIEFNGHYTHGKHPFDKNNKDDILLLEKYKNKTAPSYKTIIDVWTHRDVLKFEEVKKNNLKYIAFYGYKLDKEKIIKEIEYYEKKNKK